MSPKDHGDLPLQISTTKDDATSQVDKDSPDADVSTPSLMHDPDLQLLDGSTYPHESNSSSLDGIIRPDDFRCKRDYTTGDNLAGQRRTPLPNGRRKKSRAAATIRRQNKWCTSHSHEVMQLGALRDSQSEDPGRYRMTWKTVRDECKKKFEERFNHTAEYEHY